jgi:hypothetical protein
MFCHFEGTREILYKNKITFIRFLTEFILSDTMEILHFVQNDKAKGSE